jgi:hypothetical protein
MVSGQPRPDLTGFLLRDAAGRPAPRGLYDPEYEHDNCGVGFVAALDGVPRVDLVKQAIRLLVNLEHRGAVGGDKATGDGAGMLLGLPDVFLRRSSADGFSGLWSVCEGSGADVHAGGSSCSGLAGCSG